MLKLAHRLGALVLCAAFGLLLIAGCANEKRKVTVIEEQHEGEVIEDSHGTMIVE